MDDNSDFTPALVALVAGIILVGSALGLFLLLSESPGAEERDRVTTTERAGDQEEDAESGERGSENDDGPSLRDLLELLEPSEPARCADPDACREPSPELLEQYGDPTSCDWFDLIICIVPIGDVPVDLLQHLVDYYEAEYGLDVRVLRAISVDADLDTVRAGQIEADLLREYFFTEYFVYDQNEASILIGLTAIDIYTAERPEWNWFFGGTYRFPGEERPRQAVISIYRMDPVSWGDRADDDLRNQRVRKLMNKYVALTYYGLELNDDPDSVMFRTLGGLGALDRIDERIPEER